MELTVGTIVTGKVTGITRFGAFVELEGGRSGLVHISEVSGSFVNDVHDFLTEGQEVQVKILAVSPEGKINLSIKQAQAPSPHRSRPPYRRSAAAVPSAQADSPAAEPSFEDKLKQFLSVSDSKQSEVNRHIAGKRGGRRRK